MAKPALTVDAYLQGLPEDVRPILEQIRRDVGSAIPAATECISYGMPAFKLRRTFFYYGAFTKHLGVYPPVEGNEHLLAKLAPYQNAKGNLAFPFGKPIPYPLIVAVAVALGRQYA